MSERRTGDRSGFTLAEVIIAMTVISAAALIFAYSLVWTFRIQMGQKEITKSAFELQKTIERKMEEESGNEVGHLVMQNVFLPGHHVKYKPIEDIGSSHAFYSLVAYNNKLPGILPSAARASIRMGDPARSDVIEYASVPNPGAGRDGKYKILGKFALESRALENVSQILVRWYASSTGYTVPKVSGKIPRTGVFQDMAFGRNYNLYPQYPYNYELIYQKLYKDVRVREAEFEDAANYAGRHILMTVIPVTNDGALGDEAVSNAVFVHGLKSVATENLEIHLDASAMKKSDLSGTEVRKWINLVKMDESAEFRGSSKWIAGDIDASGNPNSSYTGHLIELPVNSEFTVSAPENTDVTVFVMVKEEGGVPALTKDDIILNACDTFTLSENLVDPYKLYVFSGRTGSGEDGKKVGIHAGTKNLEIADFLVYRGKMYTDPAGAIDSSPIGAEVFAYMKSKCGIVIGKIYDLQKLLDFTVTADPEEAVFTPPKEVIGLFDNKQRRAVLVEWTVKPDVALNETNNDVRYIFRGHAVGDGGKNVTMTVIKPPRIPDMQIEFVMEPIFYSGKHRKVKYVMKPIDPNRTIPDFYKPKIDFSFSKNEKLKFLVNNDERDIMILQGNKAASGLIEGEFELVAKGVGNVDIKAITQEKIGGRHFSGKKEVFVNNPIANYDAHSFDADYISYADSSIAERKYVKIWKDRSGNSNDFTSFSSAAGDLQRYAPHIYTSSPGYINFVETLSKFKEKIGDKEIYEQEYCVKGFKCDSLKNIGFAYPHGAKSVNSTIVIVFSLLKDNKKGTLFSYSFHDADDPAIKPNYAIEWNPRGNGNVVIGNGGSDPADRLEKKVDFQINGFNILAVTNEGKKTENHFRTKLYAYDMWDKIAEANKKIPVSTELRNKGFTLGAEYNKSDDATEQWKNVFEGSLREVLVFDRVLSPEEIDELARFLQKKWKQ